MGKWLPPADGDGAQDDAAPSADRGVFGAEIVEEPSELCLGDAANGRPMREGERAVGERFASILKRETAPSDPRHLDGGTGGG